MTANVLVWDDDQRRVGSIGAFAAAVVVVLGALAAWWFAASTPAWLYWVLVGLLVLVMAFMVVLLFVPARSAEAAPAAEAAHVAGEHDHTAPEEAHAGVEASDVPAPVPAAAQDGPLVLTLRCGDCGTIFDVTDTGERPLYHTCPGCGAEGALRDPGADEAQPEPAPASAVVPAPAPTPAPAAPTAKKLKLRCGGCKEVFTIEDTGERPLKRGCPHCGRMGQIS